MVSIEIQTVMANPHHREHQSARLLGDFQGDGSTKVFDFTPYIRKLTVQLADLAVDLVELTAELVDQAFLEGLQIIFGGELVPLHWG